MSADVAELQAWIRAIVSGLVTARTAIAIRQLTTAPTVLQIEVAADDVGKVIGKDGATISAIRRLAEVYGVGHGLRRVVFEVAGTRSSQRLGGS